MQYKLLILGIFKNIGQLLCPKSAFRLIYIDIITVIILKIMPDKMLKFVNIDMQMPTKRTSDLRTEDFK